MRVTQRKGVLHSMKVFIKTDQTKVVQLFTDGLVLVLISIELNGSFLVLVSKTGETRTPNYNHIWNQYPVFKMILAFLLIFVAMPISSF